MKWDGESRSSAEYVYLQRGRGCIEQVENKYKRATMGGRRLK